VEIFLNGAAPPVRWPLDHPFSEASAMVPRSSGESRDFVESANIDRPTGFAGHRHVPPVIMSLGRLAKPGVE